MTAIFTTYLFWQFVVLNFVNVLVNTARSLCTIKGGKWVASIMNAICYGYYTVIIVITATYDMPLLIKCFAVAFVNFVGVFTIKFCEEKMKKPSLWIYNAIGIDSIKCKVLANYCKNESIKYAYLKIEENFYNIEIFSETSKDSEKIVKGLENLELKYYAVEAKEKNRN